MAEVRKKYDREFREGAVRIVRETNKPIARIAKDLGSQRWGNGFGTATAAAMITHAFDYLGLNLLRATVHEPNDRSLRVVRKLGFDEVGVLPEPDEYLGEQVRVIGFELRA